MYICMLPLPWYSVCTIGHTYIINRRMYVVIVCTQMHIIYTTYIYTHICMYSELTFKLSRAEANGSCAEINSSNLLCNFSTELIIGMYLCMYLCTYYVRVYVRVCCVCVCVVCVCVCVCVCVHVLSVYWSKLCSLGFTL